MLQLGIRLTPFSVVKKYPGHTSHPPTQRPLMVWDGECGFCAYWISRWQKMTGSRIDYAPYQEVADRFKDINKRHFKLASHLIETDGKIYSGARSAFRSFTYGGNWGFLDSWYARKKWFKSLSDKLYRWVTRHRGALLRLSKFLFGSNPREFRPFWVIYLGIILYLLYTYL